MSDNKYTKGNDYTPFSSPVGEGAAASSANAGEVYSSPVGEGEVASSANAGEVFSSPAGEGRSFLSANAGETDEISLKDLILKISEWWKYLLSKWIIILVAGLIGGALGLAYSYSKRPIYKAELSFALEDEKGGGLGGAAGFASLVGIDIDGGGGGAFSGDNLLELMKSRSMVQKALLTEIENNGKKQTLAEFYIEYNELRDQWKNKPELNAVHFLADADPAKFTRTQDSLLGIFHKSLITENLAVNKVDKKLSIIAVNVSSENETFSKYFTEILVKEVSDFYIETKTIKSVKNLAILQHQTDSVRRALNSAITGVASSVDANPNANRARQILQAPSQRRQVDVQANVAILTELVKNLEISKVSLRKEIPLIQVIDRPILPLEMEKFGKLNGLILGGFLGGFLIIIFLLSKKMLKDLI